MPPFIIEAVGPDGVFGVFEDDGDTGYLYVYEPNKSSILQNLHIYNRSTEVDVQEKDVFVIWSADETKCGVVVWGQMRGIINLAGGRSFRMPLRSRGSPGVTDAEWLKGFEKGSG